MGLAYTQSLYQQPMSIYITVYYYCLDLIETRCCHSNGLRDSPHPLPALPYGQYAESLISEGIAMERLGSGIHKVTHTTCLIVVVHANAPTCVKTSPLPCTLHTCSRELRGWYRSLPNFLS